MLKSSIFPPSEDGWGGFGLCAPNCSDCSGSSGQTRLSDISLKDRNWKIHKKQAQKLSQLYLGTYYDKFAGILKDCAGFLQFESILDLETGEISYRLKDARFCRVRFCPICQWRRSLMWVARFLKITPKLLEDYPTARFLFLTLTVRNCEPSSVRATLNHMNKAWQRFTQRKNFPAIGFAKSAEITLRFADRTCHPHFHCLLMVKPNYFSRGYLTQEKWTEMWREALRIDYKPIVHIQTVKPSKRANDGLEGQKLPYPMAALQQAMVETFKYSVKPTDFCLGDDDANRRYLETMTEQLRGFRSVSLGGVLREYLKEEEPEDLIRSDLNDEKIEGQIAQTWYGWNEIIKDYVQLSRD